MISAEFYAEPQPRSASDEECVEPFAGPLSVGGEWAASIVLQCRQRPGSFRCQGETMGYSSTFAGDVRLVFPHVDLDKIEWMSSESPAAIPCGMLVRPFRWGADNKFYNCLWMDQQFQWGTQERIADAGATASQRVLEVPQVRNFD